MREEDRIRIEHGSNETVGEMLTGAALVFGLLGLLLFIILGVLA